MTGDQQSQQKEQQRAWESQAEGNPFGEFFGGGARGGRGQFTEDVHSFWENLEDMISGGAKESRSKKGKDILVNLELSFMEAINGCQKSVAFDRIAVCSTCNGSKSRPGTGQTKCFTCGGSGRVVYRQGLMTIQMDCTACNGEGSVIKNPCSTCYGKGNTNSKVTETINVPKGVADGLKLRVARKGHYSQGGVNGDLFVNIKIRSHPYFKRDDCDIHTVNNITVAQAVLGSKIKVKTIHGDTLVTVDPGTNDGDTKKLVNQGAPKLQGSPNQKGHHYVKFKVIIPNKLTSEQKKLFETLQEIEDKPKEINYDD
jgi:molecular chaperone DnaJ